MVLTMDEVNRLIEDFTILVSLGCEHRYEIEELIRTVEKKVLEKVQCKQA